MILELAVQKWREYFGKSTPKKTQIEDKVKKVGIWGIGEKCMQKNFLLVDKYGWGCENLKLCC